MIIQQAKSTDIDVLYDLIMALACYEGIEQYFTADKEQLKADMMDGKFGALIAYHDDKPVGYLSFMWTYSIWLSNRYMNLDDLFVKAEYRGQKIGEALMNEAKDLCLSQGITYMRWEVNADNVKAIKFYEKLGALVQTKGLCRWNF